MPISSGANGWPGVYRAFKQQQQQPKKVIVQPNPTPILKRSPSPPRRYNYYRYPYQGHSPPPPYQQQYPQSSGGCCGGGGAGMCGPGGLCSEGGACGPPSGTQGVGPCCCYCGGSAIYTTGVAGANAGCFQGGMFSSKNPAYPTGQSNYVLQNTGRHRCWACIIGMLIGLLLLGLLLACILAVDPYLKTQGAIKDFLAANPGARVVGDYIIVPQKTYIDYYKVNGAANPCLPDYNMSDTTVTEILPMCSDLTTEIVWTYSIPITAPTTETVTDGVARYSVDVLVAATGCLLVYVLRTLSGV